MRKDRAGSQAQNRADGSLSAEKVKEAQKGAHRLGDDGRPSGAGHAHAKRQHEERVEDAVEQGPDGHDDHGGIHMALGPDEHVCRGHQVGEDRSRQNDEGVVVGHDDGACVGSQEIQDGLQEREEGEEEDGPADEVQDRHEQEDGTGAQRITLPQEPRIEGGRSYSHQAREARSRQDQGKGQGNGGQAGRPHDPSHENAVHGVVDTDDEHADDPGGGELHEQLQYGFFEKGESPGRGHLASIPNMPRAGQGRSSCAGF
jgi:hypothetical protein